MDRRNYLVVAAAGVFCVFTASVVSAQAATDLDCDWCVNPGEVGWNAVPWVSLDPLLRQALQRTRGDVDVLMDETAALRGETAALRDEVAALSDAVAELQAIHGLPASPIVNGNFEAGNVGFNSDYAFANDLGGPSRYTITSNPGPVHGSATSYFDHTLGTPEGSMMAVNGGASPDEVVWAQTVAVEPNRSYRFNVWHSSWVASNPAELVVRVNGIALGPPFFAPGAAGVWELYEASWDSGASTSAAIEIVNLSTLGSGGTGNDFALDDISLE